MGTIDNSRSESSENDSSDAELRRTITFSDTSKALYIPSPRERDRGTQFDRGRTRVLY
jgi:hypothetical protein